MGVSIIMAHEKRLFLCSVCFTVTVQLISSWMMIYGRIPEIKRTVSVPISSIEGNLSNGLFHNAGHHLKHNGSYCAWICSPGLRIHTLQATENLYVLQSDETLHVAAQQFDTLLQCVAHGLDYNQQNVDTYLRLCSLNAAPVTRNQTVKRAIGNHRLAKHPYFGITKLEPGILTIALSWKSHSDSNWQTLVDKSYPVRNVTQLCFPKTNGCDVATRNTTSCELQFINALPSECIDNLHVLERSKVSVDHTNTVHEEYPLYVHIIKGGIVNSKGSVRVGYTELIPSQCKASRFRNFSTTLQKLKEVFVISQYWGGGYYHGPIECFPRLASYLAFLKKYPHVKIHAAAQFLSNYLPLVGLDPGRLVLGEVEADVIYLPQGGGCGTLHPISGRLLQDHYARYIQQHLASVSSTSDPPPVTNTILENATHWSSLATGSKAKSIILIQRTKKRWLAQHEDINGLLAQIAPAYNLTVEIYSEKKLPSFNDTVSMFSRAKLVVAPHGAGLSNAMFSTAGTRVIEILCNPVANLCYRQLHTTLGQPYVGLLSIRRSGNKNGSCGGMTVDLTYFKMLVKSLLEKEV